MNSQNLQEIILSTIEQVSKNMILNTNYLTLINGQITYVDKFKNYYNFSYQKEEYTGFSITGEQYKIGDLVYVLRLNNDITAKQMIISKVNDYTNLNMNTLMDDTINEIKDYIDKADIKEKTISIIGNTVFTLNDDLSITPNELSLSAQKSSNIKNIKWFINGEQQVQDNLKRLVISSELVKNTDSLQIRVEDADNDQVFDEVTVIRALKADTKLELDLGLDSILLQKDEKGVIDYSKAILTPRVLSDNADVTEQGWEITYKIEQGDLTIVKEQQKYKITDIQSDQAKLSFFAKKNGNMYLQKIIYISIVAFGEYKIDIKISNQNFVIPLSATGLSKKYTIETIIKATRGSKILKVYKSQPPLPINSIPGVVIENDDGSIIFKWDIPEGIDFKEINGDTNINYIIENEEYTTTLLWTTISDGADGAAGKGYYLELTPKNIIKNSDNTFTPNELKIESKLSNNNKDIPYDGYFKLYKTLDNQTYTEEYSSSQLENSVIYNLIDTNIKAIKIEFFNQDNILLITEYSYINVNSSDFVETTKKTEENKTELSKVSGKINSLVEQTTTIEQNITDLTTGVEQNFKEVNKQYSEITQTVNGINSTVATHTQKIDNMGERLTTTESNIEQVDNKIVLKVKKAVQDIEIGGRNYIKKQDYSIDNSSYTIIKKEELFKSQPVFEITKKIADESFMLLTNSKISILPQDAYTISIWLKTSNINIVTPPALAFYTETNGILSKSILSNINSEWQMLELTYKNITAESIDNISVVLYPIKETKAVTDFSCIKLEKGIKATDWTPAVEDMVSSDELNQATEALDQRVNTTSASIELLNDQIANLVVGKDGSSMMTQDESGWHFDMSTITGNMDAIQKELSNAQNEHKETEKLVNNINSTVDAVNKKTAFIDVGTDTDGRPTMILGSSESNFKVVITNESIDFMEGSNKIAYASNNRFYAPQMVTVNSIQVGEAPGFKWEVRASGNMGLVYISK